MMRSRILPGSEEIHRLRTARVAGIENSHPVAEHVADIEVIAVQHDLDAVRPPTDVAVGKMLDPVTYALLRDRRIVGAGRARHSGERRQAQQNPQMRAAALHGFPLTFLNALRA